MKRSFYGVCTKPAIIKAISCMCVDSVRLISVYCGDETSKHLHEVDAMSGAFLNRLKNKQLTNVDQYRRLQQTLCAIKTDDQQSGEVQEDWKSWQLVPITAGRETNDPRILDPNSKGAQGIYRAIKVMDKK